MPHLIQPGAGEHSTHRSTASLRDQADNQPNESMECRGGKARAEHGQQTGQRARCGGAGRHRRITLTRTVNERSMLSSSPAKIHKPLVTGVSPRPTDQRGARKTAKHERDHPQHKRHRKPERPLSACRVPELGHGTDQRFQAAASYWLIKPPRIGRRRILPWIGSGTGASGRGGRSSAIDAAAAGCSARVLGKHAAQVSLTEDQHPVGDPGADGRHEAFREAVCARTPRRDLDHLDARVRLWGARSRLWGR